MHREMSSGQYAILDCTRALERCVSIHQLDAEAFTGLARIRGVQCQVRYAEAFHLDKLVIAAGPVGASTDAADARPATLRAGY